MSATSLCSNAAPELKKYENQTIGEIADAEHKHPVDVHARYRDRRQPQRRVLYAVNQPKTRSHERNDQVRGRCRSSGVSDGGAHTKFFTGGRYATETLIKFARDNPVISLEEAHWRLSAHPAMCAGFKNRGTLVEGAAADIVVYDLERLKVMPMEIVHDFPGGEWRRVQRAEGYKAVVLNGEITFEDGRETGALPGRLLRHGL